jgi:hypothetical protein
MSGWLKLLAILSIAAAVFFLVFRPLVLWFDGWVTRLIARRNRSVHVYDKADYHADAVDDLGLPHAHAVHHTAFFLAWLLRNGLMDPRTLAQAKRELARHRSGALSMPDLLLQRWDGVLHSGMLGERGNAFARHYFDFARGAYHADLAGHLQAQLPTPYHVAYTAQNEATIHAVIDERYREWARQQGR